MNKNLIIDIRKDTCILSDVGKVRKENEDNHGFAETPNGAVFVICDGMGGHVGGKIASEIAVSSIINYFNQEAKIDIFKAMDEAIRLANKNIYDKTIEDPELKGMGTTVVLTIIKEDKVYIAHVGDSRIYLLHNGRLYHLTSDHSYVQGLIDNNIITPEQAEQHSKKNQILKALGIKEEVEPEVAPDPLLLVNGDRILMCSDGLSDMVNDRTIQSVLKKNEDVKTLGTELLNLALNAGGKDNITLHIIQITKSNYKESFFVDKSNIPLETTDNNLSGTNDEFDKTLKLSPDNQKKKILNLKNLLIAIVSLLLLSGLFWYFYPNKEDSGNKEPTDKKKETINRFIIYFHDKEKDSLSKKGPFYNRHEVDSFYKEFIEENIHVKFDTIYLLNSKKDTIWIRPKRTSAPDVKNQTDSLKHGELKNEKPDSTSTKSKSEIPEIENIN